MKKKIVIEDKVVTIYDSKEYPNDEVIADLILALVMAAQSKGFDKQMIIKCINDEWD